MTQQDEQGNTRDIIQFRNICSSVFDYLSKHTAEPQIHAVSAKDFVDCKAAGCCDFVNAAFQLLQNTYHVPCECIFWEGNSTTRQSYATIVAIDCGLYLWIEAAEAHLNSIYKTYSMDDMVRLMADKLHYTVDDCIAYLPKDGETIYQLHQRLCCDL